MTGPRTAPRAGSTDARPLVLAELGLLALAVGTMLGLGRVFTGLGWATGLLLVVVASWAVALVLRRLGLRVALAVPLGLALGAIVVLWRYAPGDGFLALPTGSSLRAVRADVRGAFVRFDRLIAPVPAARGFLLPLAALLWVLGQFADTAALRLRAAVQAVLPYGAVFVGTALLARDSGRLGATMWFVLGLGAYVVGQRALAASEVRWFATDRARGVGTTAVAAATLGVLALVAVLLAAPFVTDRTEGAVDLRDLGRPGTPRTVVSPFVGIRNLLGTQGDRVMFTVVADRPVYWRLTALDTFDPAKDLWVSDGTYRRTGAELDRAGAAAPGLAQEFTISGLGGPWLPAAFEPTRVTDGPSVGWDPATSSLLVRSPEGAAPGTAYRVDSTIRTVGATTVAAATAALPAGARTDLRALPVDDPDRLRAFAASLTAGATNDLERALALQRFFRDEFTYDPTADYRSAADPFWSFIERERGFCQQFSSAFALLARAAGLPARVAVGFTPGDAATLTITEDGRRRTERGFVVRGRHAHAWPEVHFAGLGWLAFEPTPERGNPQATSYSGVPPQQAPRPSGERTTTTSTTTSTTSTTSPGASAPTTTVPGARPVPRPTDAAAGGRWWLPVGLALVVVVLVVAAVRLLPRLRRRTRRRRALADPSFGPVGTAWADTVARLRAAGVRMRASETPAEFADRATGALVDGRLRSDPGGPEEELAAGLRELAESETRRRYSGDAPTADEADRAEVVAAQVATLVDAGSRRRD